MPPSTLALLLPAAASALRTGPVVMIQSPFSPRGSAAGLDGERIYPNTGGERVVRTKSESSSSKSFSELSDTSRRNLLIAAGGAVTWSAALVAVVGGAGKKEERRMTDEEVLVDLGDAVTSPALETRFLETAALVGRGDPTAGGLVDKLEKTGGSQLRASYNPGRWTLPWVGGWECKWISGDDLTFLGGPALTTFSRGGTTYQLSSTRNFVYGPGAGGINVEYLFGAATDGSFF